MFSNCISLRYVKCLASYNPNSNLCTTSWLSNVSDNGQIVISPYSVLLRDSSSGTPVNWSVIVDDTIIDESDKYFCIRSLAPSNEISFGTKSANFEVSYDRVSWQEISCSGEDVLLGTLNAGQCMYIRGDYKGESGSYGYFKSSNGKVEVSGNILSLSYGSDFKSVISIDNYIYNNLFRSLSIVDASKLVLPDFTSANCYYQMFYYCTSLVTAPKLPAKVMSSACYKEMFY